MDLKRPKPQGSMWSHPKTLAFKSLTFRKETRKDRVGDKISYFGIYLPSFHGDPALFTRAYNFGNLYNYFIISVIYVEGKEQKTRVRQLKCII